MKCKKFFVIFVLCWMESRGMTRSEIEEFSDFLKRTSQLDQNVKSYPGIGPDIDSDEDEPSDHAWEESGKFEGDLVLNERQRRLIVEDVATGLSRNGLRDSTKRWPNNEVIYYIQKEHFTDEHVQAIQNGIDDLAQASCVKFRPYKKGDRDAVVIQGTRRGCFSQVGYQGGYQLLNLSGRHPVGRGCFRHGTVVHELLHTLGFYHMQSSPDRDDYIDVAWENIIEPAKHNFRKYNAFSVSDFGVGYDYDSVLHYSRRAFSSNGKDTLVPKQSGVDIGQRIGLSDKDTKKLNKMYCDADSDSFNNYEADEETTQKPVNIKKSRKNKPFEGHGIGYHQGKTVVIKLPAAETYKLPDIPSLHIFDYFSKLPQTVSPTLIEGFGIGKEMKYSYTPPASIHNVEFEKPETEITKMQTIPENFNINEKDTNVKLLRETAETETSTIKNSLIEINKPTGESKNEEGDLSDAFERLGKIIKSHMYPTNTPDFSRYGFNTDYSEFYNPEIKIEQDSEIKKVDKHFHSSLSTEKNRDESDNDTKFVNVKSPQRFIENLYYPRSNEYNTVKSNSANSQHETEGFGIGKEKKYLYTPPASIHNVEFGKPETEITETHTSPENFNISEKDTDLKPLRKTAENETSTNKNSLIELNEPIVELKNDEGDLSGAFERLGKIIKSHSYPTNTPDFSRYGFNTDYSEFYNPKSKIVQDQEIKTVDEAFRSSLSTEKNRDIERTNDESDNNTKLVNVKSPQRFIENLYYPRSSEYANVKSNSANSQHESEKINNSVETLTPVSEFGNNKSQITDYLKESSFPLKSSEYYSRLYYPYTINDKDDAYSASGSIENDDVGNTNSKNEYLQTSSF